MSTFRVEEAKIINISGKKILLITSPDFPKDMVMYLPPEYITLKGEVHLEWEND